MAVGSLLRLVQCMCPDVALAANSSARTAAHFAAMLDVIRYVGSTVDSGITCGHGELPMEVWLCELCRMPVHPAQHDELGDVNVWGSCLV
jgi:hypothetical protein